MLMRAMTARVLRAVKPFSRQAGQLRVDGGRRRRVRRSRQRENRRETRAIAPAAASRTSGA
ncbi:hypothetical protein GCM10011367_01040 [Marinicauda pacifica]|nr:hypothetical protein GCM10011367_01040 [Marinicauda pacifica]